MPTIQRAFFTFRLRDLMRQPPGMVTTALRNGCVTGQTCMGWSWVVKLVIHGKVDTTSIGKQCCAEYYFEYFNFIFISFGSRSTKLFGFRVQSVQTCLYNLIIVQWLVSRPARKPISALFEATSYERNNSFPLKFKSTIRERGKGTKREFKILAKVLATS